MAYLGQRTFVSFEKKARGWGDFFEEEEKEFGQGLGNDISTELSDMKAFKQEQSAKKNSLSHEIDKPLLTISLNEDESGVIIETDSLVNIFFNKELLHFLAKNFPKKDNYNIRHLTAKVILPDEEVSVSIKYYPNDSLYTINHFEHLREFDERNLKSIFISDWLSPLGKIQFEAMKNHIDSGGGFHWSEFTAPDGSLLLVKSDKLHYIVYNYYKYAISYSDFQDYIEGYKWTWNEVPIKQFYKKNGEYAGLEKVEVYIVPDIRTEVISEKEEGEEETIIKTLHTKHQLPFYIFENNLLNYNMLKEVVHDKSSMDEEEIILTMRMFNEKEQKHFKKDKKMIEYVQGPLSNEEMAWAITNFDTSIFTLWDKLNLIKKSESLSNKVDYEAIRPILEQYPKSRGYNEKLSTKEDTRGHDDVRINKLNRKFNKHIGYKKPTSYRSGNYDDVTDKSDGIVGLESENTQNRIEKMYILSKAYKAYIANDDEKLSSVLKATKNSTNITNKTQFENWINQNEKWFLKFFRDNALKISFMILDITEDVLIMEMEDYQTNKIIELERDFTEYRSVFEELQRASIDLYHGTSVERSQAIQTIDAGKKNLRDFVMKKHPYILDLEYQSADYNWVTRLVSLYSDYKNNPSSFHDYFNDLMHNSLSDRLYYVYSTRSELRDDPEFVWELEQVVQITKNYLGFKDGDIFDQLIKSKIKSVEDTEFWTNIGILAGAVVLGVISGGLGAGAIAGMAGVSTATVTTTAAIGGVAISALEVSETYDDYSKKHAAANINTSRSPLAGLTQDDPSFTWVVLAIAGLGLDLGAAVKVFKALKPATKALNETGSSSKFEKVLAELTEQQKVLKQTDANKLLAKVKAQQEVGEAFDELSILLRSRAAANPFFDPEVIAGLGKLAIKSIKVGVTTFDEFLHRLIAQQKIKKTLKGINFEKLDDEQLKQLKDIFGRIEKIKLVGGEFPINAQDFAGKKFDFDLVNNQSMREIMTKRWKSQGLTDVQILAKENEFNALLKKYPEGVIFTEAGFPNFSKYRYKHNGQEVVVDIKKLNPDPPKGQGGSSGTQLDISDANKAMKEIDPNWRKPADYTWHHIENTTKLELVPTDLHQAVRHTGGRQTGTY